MSATPAHPAGSKPRLVIDQVSRLFAPSRRAGVSAVSLSVDVGKSLTIVGPSGAGKTTLLRLIAGLDAPDRGAIVIDGQDVTHLPPQERDIGLVPQRPALYPQLSVLDNLAIGAQLQPRHKRPEPQEIRLRVHEAVQLLGLNALVDNRPSELSGGEQQRVMLGRLLVRRPRIWLLDEPFGHLDMPVRAQLRRDMLLLRDRFLPTIVAVTHDPVEALTSGDCLAVLFQGRVRQVGAPTAVLEQPLDSTVASFLGWPPMNLATGVLVRSATTGSALQFAAADGAFRLPVPAELVTHGAEGQPVTVGVRPEALQPLSATPALARVPSANWVIRAVESLPPAPLVHVHCRQQEWMYWWHDPEPPVVGANVALSIPLGALHWFDGSGQRIVLPARD